MSKELIIPVVVVLLSVAFLDPFMVLMPSMLVYTLLALLLAVFAAFALLVFKEVAEDEREDTHRAYSGRVAYFVGAGMLVLGIGYQVLFLHEVDPLLVVVLTGMTIAKYASLAYAKRYL
ncbi:MAG: putative membrane protein [Candidatus Azotimanducaceae bacterium]|jgi:uncharacterized membrane protein